MRTGSTPAAGIDDAKVVEPELHADEVVILGDDLEAVYGGPVEQALRIEPGVVPRAAIFEI